MHVDDYRGPSNDPVAALCRRAKRLWSRMDRSYNKLSAVVRDHEAADALIADSQAVADETGRQYEGLCDQICKTEATTLEGVLAKLECATQCIRDIVPEGRDPEQVCDIELRFVFAVERDVRRLVADARPSKGSHRPGATPRNREIATSARGRRPLDAATIKGAGRVT